MVLSSVLDFLGHRDYRFDFPFGFSLPDIRVLEYAEEESGWRIYRSSDLFGITAFCILHFPVSTLKETYQRQIERRPSRKRIATKTASSRLVVYIARIMNLFPRLDARSRR